MTKDEFDALDESKKEILRRLYQTNNKILKNINVRLLDDYYLKSLGEDKITLISCYPRIQTMILKLSRQQYNVFSKCFNSYLQKNNTDDWTTIAYNLLVNIDKYNELTESIEDFEHVDVEKLTTIMQSDNFFNIKSIQDVEKFEDIKKQKCDAVMSGKTDITEKKGAALQRIFGIELKYAQTIVEKFGEDIEQIEDCDEKELVLSLIAIISLEDEDVLRKIYDECTETELTDKALIERKLKNAYGKLFNEELYSLDSKKRMEEEQLPEELRGHNLDVYDAGTEFKMIITSIGSFSDHEISTFPNDWNRPSIGTQQFCASYIRNDMLGTASIPYLCYGFSHMKEDALMLAGPKDISSGRNEFVEYAYGDNEKYYSPDTHINNTQAYNELDFRRIQGGTKKQPDYIVAFQREGDIPNKDLIIRAFKEWEGKLPIVIIDVDRCLDEERKRLDILLEEYNKKPSKETGVQIVQKFKNNQCTDENFYDEVWDEVELIQKELQVVFGVENVKKTVGLQDLQENNSRVTASERQDMVSAIANIRRKIQEIVK